jgi:class 3 adenylate cyclase
MAGQEWKLYVKTMVNTAYSGAGGDLLQRLAELWSRSVSPSELPVIIAGLRAHDSTGLLSQVQAPTLVIHWRDNRIDPVEEARRIAGSVAGAELLVIEGEDPWPDVGRWEAAARAIDDFLGEPEPIARVSVPGGPVTVLFTDITGSTALTQHLGDARAQELLRTHNTIVRDALKAYGGSEIKHTGDGIMASFPFASRALECAVAIQRGGNPGRCAAASAHRLERGGAGCGGVRPVWDGGTARPPHLRPRRERRDRRLRRGATTRGGQGLSLRRPDRGEEALRGFEDPVRLYEVRWREET